MLKTVLVSSLLIFGSSAFAADITLEPNGKIVNIHGTTVTCQEGRSLADMKNFSDETIIGMAKSQRLGTCSVYERVDVYNQWFYTIYIETNGTDYVAQENMSRSDAADALRKYYAAGACR